MKNYTKFLAITLLSLTFLSSSASADAFKGGRILGNAMIKHCPMILADIAGSHSKADWATIVQEGKLVETMHSICPKTEIKPIAEDNMKDVLDFLQYYARDGGALPSC